MIPEFGQFALILAFCLALNQVVFSLLGFSFQKNSLSTLTKPIALGQFLFLLLAFLILIFSLLRNDFSVQYIAANSNVNLPWPYKIAALWGAHEGSLLLWVVVLGFWSALVALNKKITHSMKSNLLGTLGFISCGFLLFLLSTSNPFKRLLPSFPTNGTDLNALLQDPGLAIHPPLLYLGYVGFAVIFAFAIEALLTGRLDNEWVRRVRPWAIAAWCFLTTGITLGSWWAYRVLGWGGWWFWDPVENAALLPWLTATAFIHVLALVEKRESLKNWTILLAMSAFSLSLLGTFLVRSGILISVHSFAEDPTRGKFLLEYLGLVIGSAFILFAIRAPKINNKSGQFNLLSRETFLLLNNILLIVMMCTVLLGTLYPLVLDVLGQGKISVGPPYFNTMIVPFVFPLLLAMGIAPLCDWEKISVSQLFRYLLFPVTVVMTLALLILFVTKLNISALALIATLLAAWIIVATLQMLRLQYARNSLSIRMIGMALAHIGMAISVIGIALTTQYKLERDVTMQLGDSVNIGSYQFRFLSLQEIPSQNYASIKGKFEVFKNQKLINVLYPEKRTFPLQQTTTTIAAIDAGLFRDLYISLGDNLAENKWSVRIYYKPFVRWIWAGGIFMLAGGLLTLFRRKNAAT